MDKLFNHSTLLNLLDEQAATIEAFVKRIRSEISNENSENKRTLTIESNVGNHELSNLCIPDSSNKDLEIKRKLTIESTVEHIVPATSSIVISKISDLEHTIKNLQEEIDDDDDGRNADKPTEQQIQEENIENDQEPAKTMNDSVSDDSISTSKHVNPLTVENVNLNFFNKPGYVTDLTMGSTGERVLNVFTEIKRHLDILWEYEEEGQSTVYTEEWDQRE